VPATDPPRPQPTEPAEGLVERVAALFGAFGAKDVGVPVAELARRTGLPRSTTHRLVDQLVAVGLLERDGSAVTLGLRMFELGQLVPQQLRVRSAVSPYLNDLREATRHTANVAIIDGADMIYLDRVPWRSAPQMPFRPGSRHPAHGTAMGKAIMAHLPADHVDLICAAGLAPLTPGTITRREELEEQLTDIRATGLSFDRGETREGVFCVASPVFDGDGTVLGAISVTGMAGPADVARCGPAVRNAALNLSRSFRGNAARALWGKGRRTAESGRG
jgi:DNA-binding IclR family transcriptional regulator